MDTDEMNEDWQKLRPHAVEIGHILSERYHAVNVGTPAYPVGVIPQGAVEPITDQLVTVIAEVIQSWIDAGSEREVTMENETLHQAIYDELKGWSDHKDNAPVA